MAIFSEIRANLYQHAAQQERNKLANLSTAPDHILRMIFERTGGKYLITYADVVDHLTPTFDEAKRFGVQRVFTFNKVVKMLEDDETQIAKTSLQTEIVDYLYDRLHLHRHAETYQLSDIIRIFEPEISQVKRLAAEYCQKSGLDDLDF